MLPITARSRTHIMAKKHRSPKNTPVEKKSARVAARKAAGVGSARAAPALAAFLAATRADLRSIGVIFGDLLAMMCLRALIGSKADSLEAGLA